jgi:serine protease
MRKEVSFRSVGKALVVAVAVALLLAIALPLPGLMAAGGGPESGKVVTAAPSEAVPPGAEFVPGEIIVKFKQAASASKTGDLVSQEDSEVLYTNAALGFKRVKIPRGRSVPEMVARFKRNPLVEYAEPNYVCSIQKTVNDPLFRYQWHLQNSVSGSIHVSTAWDLSTGSSSVIVAVVDTGVAYENYGSYQRAPDLAQTVFVSPYDAVDGDGHPNDVDGHGTHVTGTIAQSTNNGIGTAGVAYGCSIMPVRVFGTDGGYTTTVADGFIWAADHGAKVINYSGGSDSASTTLLNACSYARSRGVTICAAAGNTSGATIKYPAAYDQYCIAVGATRYDETLSYYSGYGSSLDVVAPGGDTTVDQNGDGYSDGVLQQTYSIDDDPSSGFAYRTKQGTSMATPHVSGVAALYISRTGISDPAAVQSRLQSTARDLGAAGRDNVYGYGIVDAYAAINVSPHPVPTTTSISPTTMVAGQPAFTVTVNGTNFVPPSVVRWNGSARTTTYVSSTKLTASIPTSDIAAVGTASVTVFNPSPGGGTSNAQTFTISSVPVPTTTSISPVSIVAGQPDFTLTVNGTNFVNGLSVVRWNGSARTTTYVSSTTLTATIDSWEITSGGTASVTVFNPAPGGGTSNAQTFTIRDIKVTSITPSSAYNGFSSTSVLLTLTGDCFETGATVKLKAPWRFTINASKVYVSSPQTLTCRVNLLFAFSGPRDVVVTNPNGRTVTVKNGFTVLSRQ